MGIVEAAPMPTRLKTLHDKPSTPACCSELGLLDRGHGDPDRGPGLVQPIDLARRTGSRK